MMRFLARCFALVCAVLFVPVLVATLFLHVAGQRLAQADTYKETLDRTHFYQRTPAVVAELMVASTQGLQAPGTEQANTESPEPEAPQVEAEETDPVAQFGKLKAADWEPLLAAALPPELLRQQAEGALDQLCTFLHDLNAPPSAKISFVDFKRRLSGAEVEAAYLALLKGKPSRAEGSPAESIPFSYNPSSTELPAVRVRFNKAMSRLAEQLPDSRDLLAETVSADSSGNTLAALNHMRMKLLQYERLASYSPVLAALLLVLVALLGVRTFKGLLLWWGVPCLLGGAIAAMLALPSASAAHLLISAVFIPQLPPQVPAQTVDLLLGLMTTSLDVMLGSVLRLGVAVGIAGFIALMLSLLLKAPARQE